ncbi:hypothetical protein [Bailinhaonella thermotolerans]|uniref:Uncharacterized protein n=1 Tax=Bailinhaonella thermotolerans TaxID=1070861 RepID=A0A3A4ATI8_9ACTN|nr:hypothetical protein [Bailinhaonella thermotolerans]RJL32703.1 hypothetical protein D5H75_14515 [Bailinhaonella thermotolerans]
MGGYVRRAALAGALAVLTAAGCGGGAGTGRPCTAAGSLTGVGVHLEEALAKRADSATVRVCWDGACHDRAVELTDDTTAAPASECDGRAPADAACAATAVPTGAKRGFAEVGGLPKRPVEVTVVARDRGGKVVLDERIQVTPRAVYANGEECGETGVQAQLSAAPGRLTERPAATPGPS